MNTLVRKGKNINHEKQIVEILDLIILSNVKACVMIFKKKNNNQNSQNKNRFISMNAIKIIIQCIEYLISNTQVFKYKNIMFFLLHTHYIHLHTEMFVIFQNQRYFFLKI